MPFVKDSVPLFLISLHTEVIGIPYSQPAQETGIFSVLWVDTPEELPRQSRASCVYLGAF